MGIVRNSTEDGLVPGNQTDNQGIIECALLGRCYPDTLASGKLSLSFSVIGRIIGKRNKYLINRITDKVVSC